MAISRQFASSMETAGIEPAGRSLRSGEVPDSADLQVVPEHQATRSRSNCKCGGPCFYCGKPLPGAHDHDHAPIPYRHGGRDTVPTCRPCHEVKDKKRIGEWPFALMSEAAQGLGVRGTWLAAMLQDAMSNHDEAEDFDLRLSRDEALAILDSATTPRGRMLAARLIAMVCDERKVLSAITDKEAA
jgi:hypothetical protein